MRSQSRGARCSIARGVIAAAVLASSAAIAKPGTHGPSVSTWDTRASSIVGSLRPGFIDGGHFFIGSYNANFTNTTGILSAQFGLHYLNFREREPDPTAHGISATAVAVFEFPVAPRYDNGIPKAAVSYFLGGAPAALISGKLNYLSIPIVTGLGLPFSPGRAVTIAPWFEISPAINVDTVIRELTLADVSVNDIPQACRNQDWANCKFPQSIATDLVGNAIDLDVTFKVGARAGLDLEFHLSDAADLKIGGMLGTLDKAFSGTLVKWVGASLAIRWDDIVPAVLPPEKRLLKESCVDVESRFRTCPQAQQWMSPEARAAKPECAAPAPTQQPQQPVPQPAPAPAPYPPLTDPNAPQPYPVQPAPQPVPQPYAPQPAPQPVPQPYPQPEPQPVPIPPPPPPPPPPPL